MAESAENLSEEAKPIASKSVVKFTHLVFFWCMGGISLIYGVRLYHDVPIHPSFIPIIGASFAAILSFTLVIAFRVYAGPMDFEADKIKVKGATGPIILWCICFLTISYGLYLLGIGDATKNPASINYQSCSTGSAVLGQCGLQSPAVMPKAQLTPPAPSVISPKQ